MKIESQVCTLEQAKRLKELGVVQDSIAVYFISSVGPCLLYRMFQENVEQEYAAFTVAELGVMLPINHYTLPTVYTSGPDTGKRVFHTEFILPGFGSNEREMHPEKLYTEPYCTEAEARAAMLIYLIKEQHISVHEINQHLLST